MNRNWIACTGFLLLMLTFSCTPPTIKGTDTESRVAQIVADTSLEQIMMDNHVPGVSIAVISNGEIEWACGFGVTEAGGDQPITPETLYQAASISKTISAVGALTLVQEGRIALDTNVNEYLTSWHVPENDFTAQQLVTLERLLSHTAGITVNGFPGYEAGVPMPSLIQVLNGTAPANTTPVIVDRLPGSEWVYSGGGYEIIEQLVEDVSGEDFPDFMQARLIDPLELTHSTFAQPLPKALAPQAATAHNANGGPLPGRWHIYPEHAAAGMWSTPTDLARFFLEIGAALKGNGVVFDQPSAQLMVTPLLNDYGLGLIIGHTNDGSLWFAHNGVNAGFVSYAVLIPAKGQGAVIMTNSDSGSQVITPLLAAISHQYDWGAFT